MMASRKKSCGSSRSTPKNARCYNEGTIFSSSSDEEVKTERYVRKDTIKEVFRKKRNENDQQTGEDALRRDENPFSFKHFLKNSMPVNNYNTGARPKLYPFSTSNVSNVEKDSGVYSCNPTELPDFVQDHLVIEQCYSLHETNQQPVFDLDNLPDFALNSVERKHPHVLNKSRTGKKKNEPNASCDLPFDLTGNLDEKPQFLNLNLPAFEERNAEVDERSESSDGVAQACSSKSESNVPKLLPDFLYDGPIYGDRTIISTDPGSNSNTTESSERRLMLENERLHRHLELAQKEISEKSKRIQILESELTSKRNLEHQETEHLEKAMEQVEDNLIRSTSRAVNAESTVTSLRKEITNLTAEITLLRLENRELRVGMNAKSGNEFDSSNADRTIKRLATDLRTAASTAEASLRQLMSGVDNLRVLASTLESVDRIEDRTKDFLLDFDEDNAAGPAL